MSPNPVSCLLSIFLHPPPLSLSMYDVRLFFLDHINTSVFPKNKDVYGILQCH